LADTLQSFQQQVCSLYQNQEAVIMDTVSGILLKKTYSSGQYNADFSSLLIYFHGIFSGSSLPGAGGWFAFLTHPDRS
jgi:hypothetical protein